MAPARATKPPAAASRGSGRNPRGAPRLERGRRGRAAGVPARAAARRGRGFGRPRGRQVRRRLPRRRLPRPVDAAALVWDRVHVGAAADGGGAVALATLAEPPYAGPRAREPYAGESRVFAWSLSDNAVPSDVEPEILPSALPRFQAPKPSSKKTGAGAVAGAPPPRLEAVATRVHGPPRSRRLEALCLDSSGALREAGATFATVWAGAHFPVGYELLLDNVHYAECEDELDFCGGVEQLPTYETDLRTVDGFFAVSMDDEELSDEVLDVVGSSRAEPPPRPYASPLTASGRVARGHADELAGASVGAVGDPTVAKFRALLL